MFPIDISLLLLTLYLKYFTISEFPPPPHFLWPNYLLEYGYLTKYRKSKHLLKKDNLFEKNWYSRIVGVLYVITLPMPTYIYFSFPPNPEEIPLF